MSNLSRSVFQGHPFHLVSPSPWPILTCVSLLDLTTSGVLSMHGFTYAAYWLPLALILLISSMFFWFRDVISEGRAESLLSYLYNNNYTIKISKAINPKVIEQSLKDYYLNSLDNYYNDKESEFPYYLAGLLEGDGHISLPSMGVTTLNRVLNPRIIFTSHINNLGLYAHIQSNLGGIGRFQSNGDKLIRYIIGDMKGIITIVNMLNGKLRTPKNHRLNDLINFINVKYNLSMTNSLLNSSDLGSNSWFSGFTEADGHFGVKIIESNPKSETRKRSVSENISLKFVVNQRSTLILKSDKPNESSMLPIMQSISYFLSSNIKSYLGRF